VVARSRKLYTPNQTIIAETVRVVQLGVCFATIVCKCPDCRPRRRPSLLRTSRRVAGLISRAELDYHYTFPLGRNLIERIGAAEVC